MGPLRVLAALQLVIIILLCVPQRRRLFALGGIGALGVVYLAVRRLAPEAFGLLYEEFRPAIVRFGEFHLLLLAGTIVFAVLLLIAYWMDTKQNRAIRAGSKVAFDRYVDELIVKKHLNLEEATAAATRIRDGKKVK